MFKLNPEFCYFSISSTSDTNVNPLEKLFENVISCSSINLHSEYIFRIFVLYFHAYLFWYHVYIFTKLLPGVLGVLIGTNKLNAFLPDLFYLVIN